jgi:drug/metabolite transporter (DMT)-like permease
VAFLFLGRTTMSVPAAFVTLVLIWATTPLAVKWSGEGPGFLFGVLGRVLLATPLCLGLLAWRGHKLPWHANARRAYAAATVGTFGAMLCNYWAAQHVPSGLIAVLFALTPMVTGLFAIALLNERSFTPAKLTGMVLAFAGVAAIFGTNVTQDAPAFAGLVALLAAVVLHSLSTVLVKRHHHLLPGLTLTGGTLVFATPLFFGSWLAFDGAAPMQITARAGLSIIYLGVIGTLLGFTLYYYLLKRVEANQAALITLLPPVLALFLGTLVNGERLEIQTLAGSALVLFGLALHHFGPAWFRYVARLIVRRKKATANGHET